MTDITATHRRLGRAQAREEDLRVQLARAEPEREKAQGLADIAARRIQALEAELHNLRGTPGHGVPRVTGPAVSLPEPANSGVDEDAALDQVDAALQRARLALDREQEAVEHLADELGWPGSPVNPEADPRIAAFPGQAAERDAASASPEGARGPHSDSELSGTTLNNPTVQVNGPGTEIAVRAASDRMRFVGAATRRTARRMDLDEIVLGPCRATVPAFCDAILVYLRDPLPVGDKRPVGPVVLRLRRIEGPLDPDAGSAPLPLMSPQAGRSPVADGPCAEMCKVEPGGPLIKVPRNVRPVFSDAEAARAALTELLGRGRSVPSGRYGVLAPLRGRRRIIKTALSLRRPDRPAFQEDDLLVASQLVTHTALSINRTVVHGREAYIADELQRTMLPNSLPQPAGVRLAARHLPAAETARVGGDWYDAIPLPGNRVALIVGDVMGHSMTSAAVMGQLRTTAQSVARLDVPPREVLHQLDEQAQRLGWDHVAACLYAVYDPVSHRITIANAGHPPPILMHQGGRAEVLEVPSGAPIGVGGVEFQEIELSAPAGATLLSYTDGLAESRLQGLSTGIELLRECLAVSAQLAGPDHPPHLETLCDEVLGMPGPGETQQNCWSASS